jgi:hypothetical protein
MSCDDLISRTSNRLPDSLQVMPEPVGDKKRLAVRGFDDVLQGVELPVMEFDDLPVVGVDRAVRRAGRASR